MRFVSMVTVAVFGFASAAMALPDASKAKDPKHNDDDEDCKCLKNKDVTELVEAYQRLIGKYDDADAHYLSEDFSDWSQSINTFIKPEPFEGASFATKDAFITAQKNQQASTPIVIEGEPMHACKKISFIWTSTFGKGRTVRGITILTTTKTSGKWQIQRIDVEFNSLSWAFNLNGYYCFFGKSFGNAGSCAAPATITASSNSTEDSTKSRRATAFLA